MLQNVQKAMKVFTASAMIFSLTSCQPSGGGASVENTKISTEEDKIFYSMGVMFGGNLSRLDLSEKELAALSKGLYDSAKGKEAIVDVNEYQGKIQEMFTERMQKVSENQKTEGKKFIENFLAEEGVKSTESGLAYKIIEEGTGANPKAEDTVEVHYHGTLLDGTVFDSSKDRGQPISFPLNRVIKGWTEGLQLVKEGGKIQLVIPADLAYGDMGAPPKIPGGATLVFDIELIKIVKNDEAAKDKKAAKPKK